MNIYTKNGDSGRTTLIGGTKIDKNHPRLNACGDLDELNAAVGLLISSLPVKLNRAITCLDLTQKCLISICAYLATTSHSEEVFRINNLSDEIQHLEHLIDRIQPELPELRAFILPGGHQAACQAHMARTICRRAERSIAVLMPTMKNENAFQEILKYINRLSDYLFILARYINMSMDIPEKLFE